MYYIARMTKKTGDDIWDVAAGEDLEKVKYAARADYDHLTKNEKKASEYWIDCYESKEDATGDEWKDADDVISLDFEAVINAEGTAVNYAAAVELMDDELREELADKLAPCTEQEFFTAYEAAHVEKFGEAWELSKAHPVY